MLELAQTGVPDYLDQHHSHAQSPPELSPPVVVVDTLDTAVDTVDVVVDTPLTVVADNCCLDTALPQC